MIEAFSAAEIIAAKRDHHSLTDAQIDWVIDAYTRGAVADEQMSALLMAILLNGMENREISRWTDAMINSGERMNWSALSRPTVDKHSTGGVGDKITLPLAPLVAACGAAVPQLSGRGLGHTGGTLDKLESIPGWRAALSNEEMLKVLQDCGAVICAAGAGLAPADKKLYALRDVTATVEAIPLIASSIMSKKIAEGTSALVLDVKTGAGAFMSDPAKAKELAHVMVGLGKRAGVKTLALVTAMDVPLGLTAGNALEVRESVEVLAGGGPSDIVELTVLLAQEMLELAGIKGADPAAARCAQQPESATPGAARRPLRRRISAYASQPSSAQSSTRSICQSNRATSSTSRQVLPRQSRAMLDTSSQLPSRKVVTCAKASQRRRRSGSAARNASSAAKPPSASHSCTGAPSPQTCTSQPKRCSSSRAPSNP